MTIYKLKNKEAQWGDYGNILLTGMTAHLDRENGLLQLERTAPYIPPLINSGLWDIVVTDSTKNKLAASGLAGLDFRSVIKKHIVNLDWTTWDSSADEPPFYPDSGEPEDYILDAPHSEQLSNELGQLWELIIQNDGTFDDDDNYISHNKNLDIFKADNRGYILVSEKCKIWIQQNAGDWIVFEKL